MTETKKGKVAKVVSILSATSLAVSLAKEGKARYDGWTLHSATVNSNAYVYPALMEWLDKETKSKAVKFDCTYSGVRRFYDGEGKATFNINGHSLTVEIEKPEAKVTSDLELLSTDNLIFTARTAAGINELERFLVDLTEERKKKQRDIYIYNLADYGWDARNFPFRNLDSVFLDRGVKEDLIDDLDTFYSNESHYRRIGVPWHRGYLFYGPPGNGKSSLAASIAHRYRMNLYNLPLSGVKDDKALAEAVAKVSDNSILLLEDIDIFSKSMGRQQAERGPTLAGLLNALDGVATPHGLMTFMTTNHIESLDPALIRPGRIDKRIELTAPSQYQIENMFEYVFDEPLGVEPKTFSSMAGLSNVFKKYATDPESARLDIKRL